MGAVHDESTFRQQKEMIASLRGPQGSRHAEPERPRTGRQHPIPRISQDRVAARSRILLRPPDARHADPQRRPATLPHCGSTRNRWHVTAFPNSPRLWVLNSDVGNAKLIVSLGLVEEAETRGDLRKSWMNVTRDSNQLQICCGSFYESLSSVIVRDLLFEVQLKENEWLEYDCCNVLGSFAFFNSSFFGSD